MQLNPLRGGYLSLLLALCASLWINASLLAQEELSSQSPFFVITSESGDQVDQFPLKSTDISVNIAGVIADVRIRQEYENLGNATLEAMYIFPASTQAAVYGVEMSIGERRIVAEVQKKAEARKNYEKAKKEGKTATLLEQKRPNVFQMSVGHILPKDRIVVELRYTELLVPENGTYEFMFPTVVGPRYAEDFSQDLLAQDQWTQNPYLQEGEGTSYDYNITTQINAGMPLKKVSSPSHEVEVDFLGKTSATITLPPSTRAKGGTKDYVLQYQLSGKSIESGLLTFEGEEENFFLAMLQPPKQVENKDLPPREFIFLLDVSGSMRGFPMEITREMITNLVMDMRGKDRFNLMLFESSSALLSEESLPPTKANIKATLELLDKLRGSGGTKLLPALKTALDIPNKEGYSRSFVIVTDGFIDIERQVFDVIRHNLNNANVFAIGAGSSVNRYLIEGMARAGRGEPLVVLKPEEAKEKAKKYQGYISQPVLTDIETQFGLTDVYDVTPLATPDVLAERPIILFGKYKGEPLGQVTLKGVSGSGPYQASIPWKEAKASPQNQALKYLWARQKIASLSDYAQVDASLELVEEITNLGLQYNLLTAYTSFIAIDPTARQQEGNTYQVKQALPLPKGVGNTALGGKVNGVAAAPASRGSNGAVSRGSQKESVRKPGSVVRSASQSSRALSWNLPSNKQTVFEGQVGFGWADGKYNESTEYEVTVKNFMGEALWETRTQERSASVDLKGESFKDNKMALLMVAVKPVGREDKMIEMALELLEGPEAAGFIEEHSSLLLSESPEERLKLALLYEDEGMYWNAFGILLKLQENQPSEEAAQAYRDFLSRRGWE